MNKNTTYILLAGIIALAGGLFAQYLSAKSQQKTQTPMIEFTLPDLTGKPRQISEWKGKIRIINF